jgi:hypothetical protein
MKPIGHLDPQVPCHSNMFHTENVCIAKKTKMLKKQAGAVALRVQVVPRTGAMVYRNRFS